MAGRIEGIVIEIAGKTSQLSSDLKAVNKDINNTQKALKDVDKALELDPTNVELLAQKEALLAKQVEQVSQKLELETAAAEQAKEALDAGDLSVESYATLQAEIVRTSESLNDLQSSGQEAAEGVGETGDAAEEAGDQAEESSVNFEAWGEAVAVAAEAAAAAVAAVGAAVAASAIALGNMTLDASALADELTTLSSVTGLSTDTLQELNYAAELVDVSTDTITGSMTRLVRQMGSAAEGSESTMEKFEELGIAITDSNGELRDSEEVFWEAIDALGEISNETERDAAAMELFGRSARELNPLIEAGSDTMAALADEAHEVGYVMDSETLDAFGNLDDNMQRLNNGATAAKNALGTILLPVLTELSGSGVDFLNDFTNAVLNTDGDLEELGSVIETMLPEALAIFESTLPMLVEIGGTIIETLINALISNLPTVIEQAGQIVFSVSEGILQAISDGNLLNSIIQVISNLAIMLINNLPTVVSAAMQIVVSVATGIANNIGTLVPAVVSCILEIAEVLTAPDQLSQLVMAALTIMLELARGLVEATPEILARIPEIIANIIEAFGDLGSQLMTNAADWAADMIQGFVNGLSSAGSTLRSGVSNVASTIASYLHFSEPDVGPLSDFNESGGDMIDSFIDSMDKEQNKLKMALNNTSEVIYEGMTGQDYTGQLSGISAQLAGMGGGGPSVINVYLGTSKLGSVVVGALNTENARTGGTA